MKKVGLTLPSAKGGLLANMPKGPVVLGPLLSKRPDAVKAMMRERSRSREKVREGSDSTQQETPNDKLDKPIQSQHLPVLIIPKESSEEHATQKDSSVLDPADLRTELETKLETGEDPELEKQRNEF